MMLSLPILNAPIEFVENQVEVLIVENPFMLRNILTAMQGQVSGLQGEFVLSENFEPIDIPKLVSLVTDPIGLEFDTKKTLGKITQSVVEAAAQLPAELRNVILTVNRFASSVCNMLDYDLCYTEVDSVDNIVKILNFRLDRSELSFPEQIIEFMRMQRDFFGKQLFAFYNLKACMSEEELRLFYKNTLYEKLTLLLIENFQHSSEKVEHTTIIDKDLCIM